MPYDDSRNIPKPGKPAEDFANKAACNKTKQAPTLCFVGAFRLGCFWGIDGSSNVDFSGMPLTSRDRLGHATDLPDISIASLYNA